jgi:hypothetical protein
MRYASTNEALEWLNGGGLVSITTYVRDRPTVETRGWLFPAVAKLDAVTRGGTGAVIDRAALAETYFLCGGEDAAPTGMFLPPLDGAEITITAADAEDPGSLHISTQFSAIRVRPLRPR